MLEAWVVVQAILTVLAAVCTAQVASRVPALSGAASGAQKTPTSPDVTGHVSSKFNRLFIVKSVVTATESCPLRRGIWPVPRPVADADAAILAHGSPSIQYTMCTGPMSFHAVLCCLESDHSHGCIPGVGAEAMAQGLGSAFVAAAAVGMAKQRMESMHTLAMHTVQQLYFHKTSYLEFSWAPHDCMYKAIRCQQADCCCRQNSGHAVSATTYPQTGAAYPETGAAAPTVPQTMQAPQQQGGMYPAVNKY